MGSTPGTDYETTTPCTHCWNLAKKDVDGVGWSETPRFIKAVIADVSACPAAPAPPNGEYILESIGECAWEAFVGDWHFYYAAYGGLIPPGYSWFYAEIWETGDTAFIKFMPPCCTGFGNELVYSGCGDGQIGYGGSVNLFWGPGISLP